MFQKWNQPKQKEEEEKELENKSRVCVCVCVYVYVATSMETVVATVNSWKKFEEPVATGVRGGLEEVSRFSADGGRQQQQQLKKQQQRLQQS